MVWGDIIKVFDRKQTLLIRTSIGTYDSSRLVSNPSLGQRIKLGSMRANALCQDWHSAVLVRLQFDVCQKSSRVGTLKTGAAESENNRRDDSLNPLSLKPLRWYPDSNEILHRRSGHWILISEHFMLKHVTHGKVIAKQNFLLNTRRELYAKRGHVMGRIE